MENEPARHEAQTLPGAAYSPAEQIVHDWEILIPPTTPDPTILGGQDIHTFGSLAGSFELYFPTAQLMHESSEVPPDEGL